MKLHVARICINFIRELLFVSFVQLMCTLFVSNLFMSQSSLYLVELNSSMMATYNFGDPRVGDSNFAEKLDSIFGMSYRVVNKADIVPHLPTISMGFNHTATEVWYYDDDNQSDYDICYGGEDPNGCADSVNPLLYNVADHLSYLGYEQLAGILHGCS